MWRERRGLPCAILLLPVSASVGARTIVAPTVLRIPAIGVESEVDPTEVILGVMQPPPRYLHARRSALRSVVGRCSVDATMRR